MCLCRAICIEIKLENVHLVFFLLFPKEFGNKIEYKDEYKDIWIYFDSVCTEIKISLTILFYFI